MKKGVLILMILIAVAILVVAGIFLFGGNSTPNNEDNVEIIPSTNSIEITGFAFSPATLTVHVGDLVIWTNKDSAPHTIISDSGTELNSQQLSNGGSYSHTFNTAGTYAYHCSIHTSMKGTIIVQ